MDQRQDVGDEAVHRGTCLVALARLDRLEHFAVLVHVGGVARELVGELDRGVQRGPDELLELAEERVLRRVQDGDVELDVRFEDVVMSRGRWNRSPG